MFRIKYRTVWIGNQVCVCYNETVINTFPLIFFVSGCFTWKKEEHVNYFDQCTTFTSFLGLTGADRKVYMSKGED